MNRAAVDRLHDEARAALATAIQAGTALPPSPAPSGRRTAARNWAIALGRWRDGRTYRALGAAHGGLSKERTRQITHLVADRWARVHLPGWEARWFDAAYGPTRDGAPAWARPDA